MGALVPATMRDQNKAYLYAIATVLLWSTVATAFKITLRYLDPLQLLLYACLASVCTLALIIVIQGKGSLIFSYSRKQYLKSLLFGLLNPCLYYMILFKAYDLLPAQEAPAPELHLGHYTLAPLHSFIETTRETAGNPRRIRVLFQASW